MRRGVLPAVGLLCLLIAGSACSSSEDAPRASGGTSYASGGKGGALGGSGGSSAGTAGTSSPPGGAGGTPVGGGGAGRGGAGPSAGTAGAGGATAGTGGAGATSGTGGVGAGGTSGGPAGGGGSGGEAAVELKMPIERGGKYTLEFGDVVFTVDPAVGARVTTFALKGKNLLTDSAADMSGPEKNNWGSTFWPSPQSADSWGGMDWPPIPEIDGQAYTAKVDGMSIEMKSAVSVRGKMSLVKRFTPVLNAQAVDQTFTLKNENAMPMSWAAWQITRVALNGLTFFPTGAKVVSIPEEKGPLDTSLVTNMGGVSWYKNKPADSGKYIADGAEGWIGQVSGNLLFVKKFPDTPTNMLAPNEGDAEIYAGKGYVEIEPQGPYTTLPAGMSLTWTVRWYVRELADPSIATVGNAALVQLARDVIEQ